jgi:hypothetical protein
MKCAECGADMPGEETCLDRFYTLLGAEYHSPEVSEMHGLAVLIFHLQHPSLTKPWYQAYGYEFMRRIFGEGRDGKDWLEVLTGGGMQARQADVARWKARYGTKMPTEIVTQPLPGEMTVADIDPEAPPGHRERVLVWARSVAEGRVLK